MGSHNKRSRTFALELYPEDDVHCVILDYIMAYFDYAYILHDKDSFDSDIFDENGNLLHKSGDLKKPHWHVIICFKNQRSVQSLLDELRLDHIETCNFYAYCRYLIHLDSPQKFQYKSSDIKTNIELRVRNALSLNYNSNEQDCRILLDYILNIKKDTITTFQDLTLYALHNDCIMELKKNSFFYKQFCDVWKL